jgi:VWFA-related protein
MLHRVFVFWEPKSAGGIEVLMGLPRLGLGLFMAGVAFGTQDPTFQTAVKLVQVSVIAQDKQGKPVVDLRREEFQILENGTPQEIRLFLTETEKSNPPALKLKPPNTFTNQVAPPAGSHSGYSVILIDNLFMDWGDPFTEPGSANAREYAVRALRSIPEGEKIAVYAIARKLHVICEFTSDRDLLERQLAGWKPDIDTPATRSFGIDKYDLPQFSLPEPVRGEPARIDALGRVSSNNNEMEQIAERLSGVPGRKNLIWLSNRFVMTPRAIQRFNGAGVSIYPVDVDGVCVYCPPRPKEWMDGIASQTGGVAYYVRNDLDVAIREAMDDGHVGYTLGFYPSGDHPEAQAHQLTVSVSRPGITLRYRTSYQTEPHQPVSGATKADLAKALSRPVDATAIPVKAAVTRAQDRLTVQAMFDIETLGLAQNQNRWAGNIEVVARFTTAEGTIAGEVFAQTLALNFRQATYDIAVRSGFSYRNDLKIPPKAVQLKLLFANSATGKVGTLTIPLSQVEPGVASAK